MAKQAEDYEYVDLVLLNGGIVRLTIPNIYYDQVMESIDNARARRDWWSPVVADGCRAEYMGMLLDRVDMQQVMGVL